jgi:hypothetical protein
MNTTLMQIALDVITFFAMSDEGSVDPDVAIEQLEHISDTLRQLSRVDRDSFREFVERAAIAAKEGGDSNRARVLEELPGNLGIDAEE